jgi:UDP-N-acetylmuramate: L-alanyl-gamma-D-glutamyl-meso-diaminopimelate ligase
MKIHILGICGTFMGGLAQILKDSGHDVSGSDMQFYPPMSEHLDALKIDLIEGYSLEDLPEADLYVIGNALSRGNESVEHILNNRLSFKSGPEMLGEILKNRRVFAVSGTHGKTTTSYMLTHILKSSGRDIGYLVGGISNDIDGSASLGTDEIFVIEADEYDSAFFDKRSKFIHYSPDTLVINNIEFDHADIFNNLDDIKKQFHHLIKIIPSTGNIVCFYDDRNVQDVLDMGCWSNVIKINDKNLKINFSSKEIKIDEDIFSLSSLPLIGEHNFKNYVSAIMAATTCGISTNDSIKALESFNGVRRRLEYKGEHSGVKIYDDFAHHPTAITYASEAIRNEFGENKILGIIELGSNTMSSGSHGNAIFDSVTAFDKVIWLDHNKIINNDESFSCHDECISNIKSIIKDYDVVLLMTNKDSSKLYEPIIDFLS